MQFLCAIFSHLRLICQPACVSVYMYFIAAALGHCSESSLSHLSLNRPLQRGSLGQESSCQNPGAPGKDTSMGAGDRGWAHPDTMLLEKSGIQQDAELPLYFHFTQEIRREDGYWIIHNWTSQFKRSNASFGNTQWKKVERIFANKLSVVRSDYVLKIIIMDTLVKTIRLAEFMPLQTFAIKYATNKDTFCFF